MIKIILILISICVLTGCNHVYDNNEFNFGPDEMLSLDRTSADSPFKVLYELNDGRKIITNFDSIDYRYYQDDQKDTIEVSLGEALDNNILTTNDFIDKLSLLETDNSDLYCNEAKTQCLYICENDNIVLGTDTNIDDIISECSR